MKKRPAPVAARASTASTTRIKRKKRRFMLSVPKRGFYSQKRPAFDAFEIKSSVDNGMGKRVQKVEVVAPETGIHSKAWSLEIRPQDTPLLKAPLETRTRIFEILFRSYDLILSPQKCGKGFANTIDGVVTLDRARGITRTRHSSPMKMYLSVSLVCRKIYVEVVGGALLYRVGEFYFRSGLLMSNYLSRINPFHVSSITRITLTIQLTRSSRTIPKKITNVLATAKSLKHLSIILYSKCGCLKEDLCVKIESSKNWRALKGLRSFELTSETFWNRVGVYNPVSEIDSWRFKAMAEEIRKVVTRPE
ncbi:hypothetical protein DL95DRAFT_455762 [Leptodontidium sp. 2 PMI_412]|nr:hypothetical protein BKA61DRAFT_673361 [Leptodontidium sp. MPI-SDFR-AT-0119]KAH9220975.1 hypothetical protein DL95DRAFT_455762 [Leptodontidium sp. 2 PMI_412]